MHPSAARHLLLGAGPRPARRSVSDLYVMLFGLVMATACLGSMALRAVPLVASGGSLVVIWTMVVAALVTSGLAWLTGPLAASPAVAAWVLPSPLDRREVLTPRLAQVLLVAVAAGVLAMVVLWLLMGATSWPWVGVVGVLPVSCVAWSLVAQTWPEVPGVISVLPAVIGVLLVGFSKPAPAAVAVALVGCVGLAMAWRRMGGVDRCTLVRAARQGDAMAGGALSGDGGLLLDVCAERCRVVGGRLGGHATGGWALAWLETSRVLRRLPALLPAMVLGDVWLVMAPTGGLAAAGVSLVQVVLLGVSMGTVRVLRRVPGLRRTLALPLVWSLAAPLLLVLLSVAWLVAVTSLTGTAVALSTLSLQLLALAAALRVSTSATPDFSTGLIVTEAGTLPLGALLTVIRGWDVWVAGCASLASGAPAGGILVGALVALAWEVHRL